jgi:uncharacterized membrane protein HdeD (DUF308 family)
LISFFEIRSLFKKQEKKEAALFIVLGTLAVFLGVFLLLSPGYTSFSKIMLDMFGVRK